MYLVDTPKLGDAQFGRLYIKIICVCAVVFRGASIRG
jgi:hypothetical protein